MGGSVYQREQGKMGGETPNLDLNGLAALSNTWDVIQEMIYENNILSLHDVSDGGLITTICEMAIAGNLGVNMFIKQKEQNINNYLFNEEAGIVIEVRQPNLYKLSNELRKYKIDHVTIGSTKQSKDITIKNYYEVFTAIDLDNIRQFWEITSNKLEYKQMSRESATQQETVRYYSNFEGYYLPLFKL